MLRFDAQSWLRASLADERTPLEVDDGEMRAAAAQIRAQVSRAAPADRPRIVAELRAELTPRFVELVGAKRMRQLERILATANIVQKGGSLDLPSPARESIITLLAGGTLRTDPYFTGKELAERAVQGSAGLVERQLDEALAHRRKKDEVTQALVLARARLRQPELASRVDALVLTEPGLYDPSCRHLVAREAFSRFREQAKLVVRRAGADGLQDVRALWAAAKSTFLPPDELHYSFADLRYAGDKGDFQADVAAFEATLLAPRKPHQR